MTAALPMKPGSLIDRVRALVVELDDTPAADRVSARTVSEYLGITADQAGHALRRLLERGLICRTSPGFYGAPVIGDRYLEDNPLHPECTRLKAQVNAQAKELARVRREYESLRECHVRLRAELIGSVHHRRLAELGIEEDEQ